MALGSEKYLFEYIKSLECYELPRRCGTLPLMLVSPLTYSGGSRIFPRGGREPSRGGVNTPNFPENCMKSKEFGRPGGGVRPSRPPLDPPMTYAENHLTFDYTL